MTDNIIEILKNAKSVTDVIIRNNSLDCIITSNNNGLKNEHTVVFDKDGINIKNNLTGVILRNQKYDLNIIDAINRNFNTLMDYEYEKNNYPPFDDYNEVIDYDYDYSNYNLNLLNIAFKYMDEKSSDDFIEACNKENFINENNYFLFLEFACEAGNTKIFKYLMLSYPKYFKNLNNEERSLLAGGVCFGGNKELVHILLQNKKFNFGFEALKGAILGKNFNIFEFLIENNIVNINAENEKGETILFDAIKNNYIYDIIINKPEVIDILLDNCDPTIEEIKPIVGEYLLSLTQLDINIKNEFDKTILHFATQNENPNIIKFLFKRRPEIIGSLNNKDDYGSTPLHFAAENRSTEIIKFLLKQPGIEKSLNKKNEEGWTPLHFAANNENSEAIKLLLKMPGIEQSLNEKDETGWTPIHYAAINENPDVIRFLLGKPGIEKSLIEIDEDGWISLHYAAAFNNNPEIIKLLLEIPEMKKNINFKDISGETPLYIAIINKNPEIVKFLLSQENIELEEKEINKLDKYFNYNKEIIGLMNNHINKKKIISLKYASKDLSNNQQLKKE